MKRTMKYALNFGEVRVTTLRETPIEERICDNPDAIAAFMREKVLTSPNFNHDVENLWVVFLNTRRRPIGFQIVSTGLLDQLLVHARETFRAAIVANAHAIILGHNHPSGEPSPSDADIRVTRDLIRAGQLLKIEVLDHIILGEGEKKVSLRELGYFCGTRI
jgi:DNA repair protein RadC